MLVAERCARVIVGTIVTTVLTVPAFAQSHTPDHAIVLERMTWSAARAYDPTGPSPRPALPDNLIVPGTFRPTIDAMLRLSSTFRRQCFRIAQAPYMTVTLRHPGGALPTATRARTRLHRDGERRVAIIEIPALDDTVELIGHEMEHVVEHLDGVDLRSHADRRHSTVRLLRSEHLTFETERARRVGLLIAAELRGGVLDRRAEMGLRARVSSSRR